MIPNLAAALRVVAVTDDLIVGDRDPVALCVAAIRGGATMVQLRFKHRSPRELAGLARALLDRVTVPVIINDRLDVALAVGADGVHLGPEDLPVGRVRRSGILPAGFLVGASVGSEEEARLAVDADYWGIGPFRVTATKGDAGPALGAGGGEAGGTARVAALAGARPWVAVGGVRPEDVPTIRSLGAAGVAVVFGAFGADDVEGAVRRYSASRP